MNRFALLLAASVLASPAMAECELQQVTDAEIHGEIERIQDIKRYVTAWTDNQRKCNVQFNALVQGQWFTALGAYAFKNSESEEKACAQAFKAGQKNLLQELFPETVFSNDLLVCSEAPPLPKTGLEGLTRNNTKPKFMNNGVECGWYFQTVHESYGLYQWNIIACEMSPGQYQIVDKF